MTLQIDREEAQRAAVRLYKKYKDGIGIRFKLDRKKQKIVDDYWENQSAPKESIGPAEKRRRLDQGENGNEGDMKQAQLNKETDSNSNTYSNSCSNPVSVGKKPTQFRFNELRRKSLFKDCVDSKIMSIHVSKRDERFREIWSKLINEDEVWALTNLKRLKDEYYQRQRTVFKWLKDGNMNHIVKESDIILKQYIEQQQSLSAAVSVHDAFSFVTIYVHSPFVYTVVLIQEAYYHLISTIYLTTLNTL